jgi:hypothetical protein
LSEGLAAIENALFRHTKLNKLLASKEQDLGFLSKWMKRTAMGNVRLYGSDNRTWLSDEWRADLVSLNPWVDESPLFSWISDSLTHWYHRNLGYRTKVSKNCS